MVAISASPSLETWYDSSTASTTIDREVPTIDWNRLWIEPPKKEDNCKDNKLRIKVSRKAMFSKRGKMK